MQCDSWKEKTFSMNYVAVSHYTHALLFQTLQIPIYRPVTARAWKLPPWNTRPVVVSISGLSVTEFSSIVSRSCARQKSSRTGPIRWLAVHIE